ncbi:UDP-N-acetylenolpyruvoylglucosamine reductase [candidate division WWE3 bacterium CG10_big_fil_rev_8_21_14_0_10_32_10]|uniref:UDP-N-acetylenolpyruvoylglucosamine reductase n=1 Tax=candidate division WWE3 bacterium CG10_big_fil_rev_8_21_14_0_10_32_10 TaxID=1975090 RepID=A0A2H0RA19_UNCKA|nr:MAG: UDP-N-acetylenolpyruvoylglucosamine reductase [candidate division WWE3 bacterium CG10_big_fil_rev_8_21_14_0_10_32_10]
MQILKNKLLVKLNTFKVDVKAKYFYEVESEISIFTLIRSSIFKKEKKLILGGGSNVLFTKNFNGLIIKSNIKGKKIVKNTKDHIYYQFGAGENWDDIVLFCVNKNLGGIENLSGIPGTVGATPVQNIGAYDTEVKNVIDTVEGINLKTNQKEIYKNKDCKFSYRNSIFKNKLKNKFIITFVTLKLNKKPEFKINYNGLKKEIKGKEINLKNIRNVILKIRKSKLPNIKKIGTAGSFFKNPIISVKMGEELKNKYENIPLFEFENKFKISAAWLIEMCGFKGKTYKNKYGVSKNHALVLVNYGSAKGGEIAKLATKIKVSVKNKFNIKLEEEVNII